MLSLPSTSPSFAPHWSARLELAYARFGDTTRPVVRKHHGPLRVQKHLYEEGPEVCQHILVHPPSGIAGGDHLNIDIDVQEHGWSLLTSPGAAKWYGSENNAFQTVTAQVAEEATLEWLPQETILFNNAHANIQTNIRLKENARLCYWDIIALGRKESQETFLQGTFRSQLNIYRHERLLWHESQFLQGNDKLLSSPIGLQNHSVFASFIMTGVADKKTLEICRNIPQTNLYGNLTQLPELLIARCLTDQTFIARDWFVELWKILRPALFDRQAHPPRIWNT